MDNDVVRERELQAHLEPIKTDLAEVKADVKTLVITQAAANAVKVNTKDRGARRTALLALAAAGLSALWWVPSALAHAFQ